MSETIETGLPLRTAVAVEIMGWHAGFYNKQELPGATPDAWFDGSGEPKALREQSAAEYGPWAPERDRTASQQVIDRIEEMGLQDRMLSAILQTTNIDEDEEWEWHLYSKVLPETTCQCALAVVRESRKGA